MHTLARHCLYFCTSYIGKKLKHITTDICTFARKYLYGFVPVFFPQPQKLEFLTFNTHTHTHTRPDKNTSQKMHICATVSIVLYLFLLTTYLLPNKQQQLLTNLTAFTRHCPSICTSVFCFFTTTNPQKLRQKMHICATYFFFPQQI